MTFFTKIKYFLSHWLNFCQTGTGRYTLGTILSLMYICDLDHIIKFIVLNVGYSLNKQMEFLQVCVDIS